MRLKIWKMDRLSVIGFVIVVMTAILSYGFSFEFEWPWDAKQNEKKTEESTQGPLTPTEEKGSDALQPFSEAPSPSVIPDTAPPAIQFPDVEVKKVQHELDQIIKQTRAIQVQSTADRAKLQRILDQVKIQKRLVTALKPPVKVVLPKTATTDEILRNTKLRIIAEDVRRARNDLRAIQVIPKTQPTRVKTPNLPKNIKTY